MADAKLILQPMLELKTATIESESGKIYEIQFTVDDISQVSSLYLKIIGFIEQAKTSEDYEMLLETHKNHDTIIDAAGRLIEKIIGKDNLAEILSASNVTLNFSIIAAFLNAISSAATTITNKQIQSEVDALKNA